MYILPGHVLSLAGARTIFLNEHDAQIRPLEIATKEPQATLPTVVNSFTQQSDAHVKVYCHYQ